jgi:hypothetical protein
MRGTVECVSDVDVQPLPFDVADEISRSSKTKISSCNALKNAKKNGHVASAIETIEDNGPSASLSKASCLHPKLSTSISDPSKNTLPDSPPVQVGAVLDDSVSIEASTTKRSFNASSSTQSSHCVLERRPPLSPSAACEEPQGDASYSTTDHCVTRSDADHPRNMLLAPVASPEQSVSLCSRFPTSSVPEDEQASANQSEVIDTPGEVVADAVFVNEDDVYDAEVMSDPQSTLRESKAPHVVINQMYSSHDDAPRCCENRSYAPLIPLIVLILAGISIIVAITVGTKSPTSNTFDVDADNSHPSWDDHSQNSDLTYNSDTKQYFFSNGTLYEVGWSRFFLPVKSP